MTDRNQAPVLYALIVTSKEAKNLSGVVITKEGEKFWVTEDDGGWVEATSRIFKTHSATPCDLKTFSSERAAKNFAKVWKGHPWWCQPNGEYEVVEVISKYKSIPDGFIVKVNNDRP